MKGYLRPLQMGDLLAAADAAAHAVSAYQQRAAAGSAHAAVGRLIGWHRLVKVLAPQR
ncbi:MAG TPA: hypothetical protein VE673_12970 [Pseudonocardiaceae bacterium]|nr:hypothetical protein [Pseudonocardiaceae bacterium]